MKRNAKMELHRLLEFNILKPDDDRVTFLGLSAAETEHIFGLDTYIEKYGRINENVALTEGHQ